MSEPRGSIGRVALAAMALLAGAFVFPAPAGAEPAAEGYVPRGTISAIGDAALANLRLPGKGTPEDPYVLKGYEFRTTSHAISIHSISASLVILDNRVVDVGGHGVWLTNLLPGALVRIEANTLEGVRGTPVLVSGSGKVEVVGNSITRSRAAAITLQNTGGAVVSGNVLTRGGEEAGADAYGIGALTGNARVTDNRVEMTGGTGILATSFHGPTVVARNEIRGWTGAGISLRDTRHADRVEQNDLRDGKGPAIRILDATSSAARVLVDGNTITGGDGLTLERVRGVTVSGNTFNGTATAIVADTVTGSTFRSNRFGGDLALDLTLSKGNLIYDNLFRSRTQLRHALSDGNLWNVSKTPGVNVLGGKLLGGNAWPDYTGVDVDLDGLGDVAHGLIPYGTLPRHSASADAYASLLPYGPYDQRPLVALPASAGAVQKHLPALPAPPGT